MHYSGYYNHGQFDMLTFTLWAYGDELVSDQGYTHFSGNLVHTAAHNLVVVDGREQNRTHRGDLVVWHGGVGAAQFAQADDNQAYPQTGRYRRAVIGIPFGPGRDAVVDIFEARGGNRHEWMANGCADYNQHVETSLAVDTSPAAAARSLAADGVVLRGGVGKDLVSTETGQSLVLSPGAPSEFYGTFRTAGAPAQWQTPWQVTMLPPAPVPADTPGAGIRATTADPRPGLRLHLLAPDDAQPFLCWTPRHRHAPAESRVWGKPDAFWQWWDANLMPKVVAHREGTDLDSTFVAVWEPFPQTPWLSEAGVLPEIPAEEGLGVRVRGGDATATLLYRRPESRATLRTEALAANGRFALLREQAGESALDLVAGTEAAAGPLRLVLDEWPVLPVLEQGIEHGLPWLKLKGALPGYPAETADQPHAGRFARFVQEGQAAWWLPVARVETTAEGDTRLRPARTIGFTFDAGARVLTETAFPFRILRGAAVVEFPAGAHLSWRVEEADEAKAVVVTVRTDAAARVGLAAPLRLRRAAFRPVGETDWRDVAIAADGMVTVPASAGVSELKLEGQEATG